MFAVVRNDLTDTVCGAVLIGATASANCDRSLVAGACLIGPTASQDAERSLVQPVVLMHQIKRSHLADKVPPEAVCESKLLRTTMRKMTDTYDQPVLFVAYADPAATDDRTGLPLAGWCYLAAGFFFAGETTSKRWCMIDHCGRARSARQGAVTLSRATLPCAGAVFHGEVVTADWRMVPLPPARIWLAVCTPSRMTRRQAKAAWLGVWRHLNPQRQVAAKQWISHVAWRRKLRAGSVPLGAPKPHHLRGRPLAARVLARPRADTYRRPIWVPLLWQQQLLLEHAVAGGATGRRSYAPLPPLH